jgi:hypothetical protein
VEEHRQPVGVGKLGSSACDAIAYIGVQSVRVGPSHAPTIKGGAVLRHIRINPYRYDKWSYLFPDRIIGSGLPGRPSEEDLLFRRSLREVTVTMLRGLAYAFTALVLAVLFVILLVFLW